jgi:hypothetical protein
VFPNACLILRAKSQSMLPKIDERTLTLLDRLLNGFDPVVHRVQPQGDFPGGIARLDLPAAPGAEYFFQLWFYEGGERHIRAELMQHRGDDTYFWYRPFERAEFRGSEEDLVNEFCEVLEALLVHETRIVQRRGWLFWHFRCEYRAAEMWKGVYAHSAFRCGRFKTPQISGRTRVYHSAAIASAGSAKSETGAP